MTTSEPESDDRSTGPGPDADPAALERAVAVVRAGHDGDAGAVDAARSDPDPQVRVAATGAVVRLAVADAIDAGRAAADLVLALSDAEVAVRRRAAVEVARLATATDLDPEVVRTFALALIERLDDDDRVTEVAAFSLGELPLDGPDPALDAARDAALAALVSTATDHEEHLCREAAVAALGSLGDPRGLPAVLAACTDRATVRRRAVLALAAFDDPAATGALRRLTGDRDLQVRQAAEELLAIETGEAT